MKIVINACFGGFGLSHQAVMRYAELRGISLFPFVEARDESGHLDFKKHVPYVEGDEAFCIHYSTKPLKDGKNEEGCYFSEREIERTDPFLIRIVEVMGDAANGMCAKLKIIEIPDDVDWEVSEYDGFEHVAEKHRTWG